VSLAGAAAAHQAREGARHHADGGGALFVAQRPVWPGEVSQHLGPAAGAPGAQTRLQRPLGQGPEPGDEVLLEAGGSRGSHQAFSAHHGAVGHRRGESRLNDTTVRRGSQQSRKIGREVADLNRRVTAAEHPFDGFVGCPDMAPRIDHRVEPVLAQETSAQFVHLFPRNQRDHDVRIGGQHLDGRGAEHPLQATDHLDVAHALLIQPRNQRSLTLGRLPGRCDKHRKTLPEDRLVRRHDDRDLIQHVVGRQHLGQVLAERFPEPAGARRAHPGHVARQELLDQMPRRQNAPSGSGRDLRTERRLTLTLPSDVDGSVGMRSPSWSSQACARWSRYLSRSSRSSGRIDLLTTDHSVAT
jgi:hypothetical protein